MSRKTTITFFKVGNKPKSQLNSEVGNTQYELKMKNYFFKPTALFIFIIVFISCEKTPPPTPSTTPSITTNSITGITFTTAITGGDIIDDGGDPITARGICWSNSPSPTLNDQVISETADTFVSNITGLGQHGGTYYVRAFATNSIGTSYGNEEVFDSWSLDDTKWAFLLDYDASNLNYPGDVDFFADGTTKWEEPAYPGLYTTYGTWSVSEDIASYNMTGDPAAVSYIYTGTVIGNATMSGVFTWGTSPDKTFSATKY